MFSRERMENDMLGFSIIVFFFWREIRTPINDLTPNQYQISVQMYGRITIEAVYNIMKA